MKKFLKRAVFVAATSVALFFMMFSFPFILIAEKVDDEKDKENRYTR